MPCGLGATQSSTSLLSRRRSSATSMSGSVIAGSSSRLLANAASVWSQTSASESDAGACQGTQSQPRARPYLSQKPASQPLLHHGKNEDAEILKLFIVGGRDLLCPRKILRSEGGAESSRLNGKEADG